ncbi:MAG: alpha/beta hydrolase [Sulfurifustis sp.]
MIRFTRASMFVVAIALLSLAWKSSADEDRHGLRSSLVPEYPDVIGEYVQIPGARTAGTPDALDTASFLRVRSARDGLEPKDADAVIIAMPGFSSIPAHWLYLAAQLVHKASERTCDNDQRRGHGHAFGERCRIEVWVIDRRGSNLEDTAGLLLARIKEDPMVSLDYYFGRSILGLDPARPGKFPATPPHLLPQQPDAVFRPLEQADVPFMSEWGFEAYAGDVDKMIALIEQKHGARNIFLAGHSQGGGFIGTYAGSLRPDGRRGFEKIAGLIALDPAPVGGTVDAPTAAQVQTYLNGVNALRSGAVQVFTNGTGALPNYNGPKAGARTSISGVFLEFEGFDAENRIFPARQIGSLPFSPAGDAFLLNARYTNLALAGLGIDTDPVPNGFLQNTTIIALGEGLGRLDFAPVPGTETLCDRSNPRTPPTACIPSVAQIDPNKVYGWIEAGGNGGVTNEVGKARLFGNSLMYAPSRTNVRAVFVDFPVSGPRVIYAGDMNAANWYPSNRYDSDMGFLSQFRHINIQGQNINLDVDKTLVNVPFYIARQSPDPTNPFPLVTDFTNINRTGVTQTPAAAALTRFDPTINVGFYKHTDFVSADDSLAGHVTPGQPGASAISNTLIEWVLARAQGHAGVPNPQSLGVRAVR